MGEIRINNILYSTPIQKVTQAEYDALGDAKNTNGVLYAITDGESSSSGGTSKPVELTKAQYEALGDSVKTDGILYAITDGDELSAKNLEYDGSVTGLGNNVQSAIDKLNSNLGGLIFGKDGDGNYGYYGADGSLIPFKQSLSGFEKIQESTTYSMSHTFNDDYYYLWVCCGRYNSGTNASVSMSTTCEYTLLSIDENFLAVYFIKGKIGETATVNMSTGGSSSYEHGLFKIGEVIELIDSEPNTVAGKDTPSFTAEIGAKYLITVGGMINTTSWNYSVSGATTIYRTPSVFGTKNAGFYAVVQSFIVEATSTTIKVPCGVYAGISWMKIS